MTPLQRIRKDTGLTATEAIRIHAEQGCSKSFTAELLNISRGCLFRICTRFDLHKYFKPQAEQREESRQNGGRGGKRSAENRLGRRSPVLYNGIVYQPSDPTNCMVYEKFSEYERREFIAGARKITTSQNNLTG